MWFLKIFCVDPPCIRFFLGGLPSLRKERCSPRPPSPQVFYDYCPVPFSYFNADGRRRCQHICFRPPNKFLIVTFSRSSRGFCFLSLFSLVCPLVFFCPPLFPVEEKTRHLSPFPPTLRVLPSLPTSDRFSLNLFLTRK